MMGSNEPFLHWLPFSRAPLSPGWALLIALLRAQSLPISTVQVVQVKVDWGDKTTPWDLLYSILKWGDSAQAAWYTAPGASPAVVCAHGLVRCRPPQLQQHPHYHLSSQTYHNFRDDTNRALLHWSEFDETVRT
jgi:hypothetical protein